jgi:hypothetical protein
MKKLIIPLLVLIFFTLLPTQALAAFIPLGGGSNTKTCTTSPNVSMQIQHEASVPNRYTIQIAGARSGLNEGLYHLNLSGTSFNIPQNGGERVGLGELSHAFVVTVDSNNQSFFTGGGNKTLNIYRTPSGSSTPEIYCSVVYQIENPADRYSPPTGVTQPPPGVGTGTTSPTSFNLKGSLDSIFASSPIKPGANLLIKGNSIGEVVTGFLNVFFLIAGFLLFIWLAWGVFQYIFAGGDKNKLAQARGRITWAFIGFIIIVASFALGRYAQEILKPREDQTVQPITTPVGPP